MDPSYIGIVAQVIPVLLLAGVVESRAVADAANPVDKWLGSSAWEGGQQEFERFMEEYERDPEKFAGLVLDGRRATRRRQNRLIRWLAAFGRRTDRVLDVFGAVIIKLVVPGLALAAEVAALLTLRGFELNVFWLIDLGLGASIFYVASPLMLSWLLATDREIRAQRFAAFKHLRGIVWTATSDATESATDESGGSAPRRRDSDPE